MKTSPRLTLICLLAWFPPLHAGLEKAQPATAAAKSYALRGTVTGVIAGTKQVLVKHEDIPGLMPAMTMAFGVSADLYPYLTPGTRIDAQLAAEHGDVWQLEDVRVLAEAGVQLQPGVPYRVALATGDDGFSGAFKLAVPSAGDWRICVSQRSVWVDVIPANGDALTAKACSHANPSGFTKGPLFVLPAASVLDLRVTKARSAELDVLIQSVAN